MSKIRRILLLAAGSVAAVGVALSSASPAMAWTWNRSVTVYTGGGVCVQGDAGIDHASPGGFSGNLAYADTYVRAAGCGAGLVNKYAAVKLDVYKWNGNAWVVCRSSGWTYGYTGVNQWGPTGPEVVFNYGGASSCGAGWYGTIGRSFYWDGAAWQGNTVWSGQELVS